MNYIAKHCLSCQHSIYDAKVRSMASYTCSNNHKQHVDKNHVCDEYTDGYGYKTYTSEETLEKIGHHKK